MPIKVHVACDDRLLRDAITDLLQEDEAFKVVDVSGQSETGVVALDVVEPDVTIFAVPPGDDVFRHASLYRAAAGETTKLVGFCTTDEQATDYLLAGITSLAFASEPGAALCEVVKKAYQEGE